VQQTIGEEKSFMTEPRRTVPLLAFSLLFLISSGVQAKGPGIRPLIDRSCLAGCREELQTCLREARPGVEECLLGCEDAIAEAREICAAEPRSERCRLARHEAEACVRDCREPVNECIHEAQRCARGCAVLTDPCHECREEHRACVKSAGMEGRACAQELCSDEFADAREACAGAPQSDECRKAVEELIECVEPCREKYEELIEDCREELRLCREECQGDDTGAVDRH
jgi:hypothetical protein